VNDQCPGVSAFTGVRGTRASMDARVEEKTFMGSHHDCSGVATLNNPARSILFKRFKHDLVS